VLSVGREDVVGAKNQKKGGLPGQNAIQGVGSGFHTSLAGRDKRKIGENPSDPPSQKRNSKKKKNWTNHAQGVVFCVQTLRKKGKGGNLFLCWRKKGMPNKHG